MSTDQEQRRRVLRHGVAALTGGYSLMAVGCQSQPTLRDLRFNSLTEAQQELDRLAALTNLRQVAAWSWSATLTHCTQSLRYGLTGFPEPKHALFQQTVGAAAFQVFAWRGHMHHDLSEPIPGAPELDQARDPHQALAGLHQAIDDFHKHKGRLHPHFAYGRLTKKEYELANAMHLANHLSVFDTEPLGG